MKTKDSVVFITGANRGLGLAFAHEAIRRGAKKVYAGVRTLTDANLPGIRQIRIDVTDPESVAKAAAECGDTTMVVNNAGIARTHTSMLDPAMIDITRGCL